MRGLSHLSRFWKREDANATVEFVIVFPIILIVFIAAFETATAEGLGVAVVDGKIVENLHIETARATLAKAAMIAKLEGPA